MEILNLVGIGFVTYGAVAGVNYFRKLQPKENFILATGFALLFAYLPAHLINETVTRGKEAISIALTVTAGHKLIRG